MEFSCEFCDYKSKFKHNLTRHLHIVHKIKSEVSYVKCRENGCNESFRTVSALRNHLKIAHEIETLTEELSFKNFKAFEDWKQEEEKEKNIHFVLHSGKVQKFRTECSYYYCNRTGIFNSRAAQPPLKRPKQQGTCKLNSHCTAGLTVTKSIRPSKVNVLYYKTHYNHDPSKPPSKPVSFLKVSKKLPTKMVIAKTQSAKDLPKTILLKTVSAKGIPSKTYAVKTISVFSQKNTKCLPKMFKANIMPKSNTLGDKKLLKKVVDHALNLQ